MKLKAQLQGKNYNLSIEQIGDAVNVIIDGRCYDLQSRRIDAGEYLLTNGSQIHQCHVMAQSGRSQLFEVHVSGDRYEVELIDPKRLRSGQAAGTHKDGAAYILSTMPGKVVRVLVDVGDEVQAGAGIVVVEAMKMQNEMKTPKGGTVVSLNADEGATVNAGEVLAVIE